MGLALKSTYSGDLERYHDDLAKTGGHASDLTIPISRRAGEQTAIEIRIASSVSERRLACELINKMYAWRGYGNEHMLATRETHTTFTLIEDHQVIGTLTLAVDSEAGLAADSTFRDELNTLRRERGAALCELTKFAFDASAPSMRMLAAFFHSIFLYGQALYSCSELLIEVNPRHRRFYQAMLGFERLGPIKTNESVSAPSQLMRLSVASIGARIQEHRSDGGQTACRSLYPLFFTRLEEAAVKARLSAHFDDGPRLPGLAHKTDVENRTAAHRAPADQLRWPAHDDLLSRIASSPLV